MALCRTDLQVIENNNNNNNATDVFVILDGFSHSFLASHFLLVDCDLWRDLLLCGGDFGSCRFHFQTYGVLPWFSNFRLLAEFSTPFVNQRYF